MHPQCCYAVLETQSRNELFLNLAWSWFLLFNHLTTSSPPTVRMGRQSYQSPCTISSHVSSLCPWSPLPPSHWKVPCNFLSTTGMPIWHKDFLGLEVSTTSNKPILFTARQFFFFILVSLPSVISIFFNTHSLFHRRMLSSFHAFLVGGDNQLICFQIFPDFLLSWGEGSNSALF